MIDSTVVRAHQHAAGAKGASKTEGIGRPKGGSSPKIHATCDALGTPTRFHLTLGQACDLDGAGILLDASAAEIRRADKGYGADARVRDRLKAADSAPVIPPQSNRRVAGDYGKDLRKTRHLIENVFEKLKGYRAIATRYDKTATAFRNAAYRAASVIRIN